MDGEILSNLKFISRIKAGEKLNVSSMTIQQESIMNTVMRTLFYTDGRNKSLAFIHEWITRAIEAIRCYGERPTKLNSIVRANLVEDLIKCKQGLRNLCETYVDDVKCQCNLETLIQTIDSQLEDMGFLDAITAKNDGDVYSP
jgi:hypothetical protein